MTDDAPGTWPIGGFASFEQFATEYKDGEHWKDTPWLDERGWHNDRFVETFINDTRRDYEGERFPLEAQIRAMPFFMENGRYEWYHGTRTGGTPVPIGRPVAWRIRDGMIESRFGVFSSADTGHPFSDEKWRMIQEWGTRGTSSVVFAPIGPKYLRREGPFTTLDIPKAWMFDVGFVGPMGASPGSTNNFVSNAKGLVQMKALLYPPENADGTWDEFFVKDSPREREPPQRARCGICGQEMEAGRLPGHIAAKHPFSIPRFEEMGWKAWFEGIKCPYCSKKFHDRTGLTKHIEEMQARGAPSHYEPWTDVSGRASDDGEHSRASHFKRSRDVMENLREYEACTTCHPGGKKMSPETKPFAGYTDFQDCKDKNRDKNDPDAYCGFIKHQTEDKGLYSVPEYILKAALELDAKAAKPSKTWSETLKSVGVDDDSVRIAIREGMEMDINLANFVAAHNITKLKAEVMADPDVCPSCAEKVEATMKKGVSRETALVELQKGLDDLVAEVAAKKAQNAKWRSRSESPEQKAAREAAEAAAVGKKPGDDGEGCPKGYHMDPDTKECVADAPTVTEEGLKALQDEMATQRQLLMRVIQGQMPDAKAVKELRSALPEALKGAGASDDIVKKALSEVDRIYPTDIESMFTEFRDELTALAKEKATEAVRSVVEPISTNLEEVRRKMKLPAGGPRGQVDTRGAGVTSAIQASNDHNALVALNRLLAKKGGDA